MDPLLKPTLTTSTTCLLLIFSTLSVVAKTNPQPSDLCKSPASHYNIKQLIQPPYWKIKIDSGCSILPNSTDQCTINVAFCKKLENLPGCENSGACVTYKADKTESLIAGNYTKDPFTSQGKQGFEADYPKGVLVANKFGNSCFLKLSVKFVCNESFIWQTPFTGLPGTAPTPLSFTPVTNSSCDIVIEVPYSGACLSPLNYDGLSSGSILLIIFFTGAGLYFGIGVTYNVVTTRRVSLETIPNYTFWADACSNVKAGFSETRRFFSSGCTPTKANRYDEI